VAVTVFEIANLRDYPEHVSEVAAWHHGEWLQGYRMAGKHALLIELDKTADLREREHNLRTHFNAPAVPSTFIALAETNAPTQKQVIGSVSIVYYQFSKQRQASEWITNLYVVEAFRNNGIGEQLLEAIHQYAAQNAIENLKLYTRDKEAYYLKRDWAFSHEGLVQGNRVSVLHKRVGERLPARVPVRP